MLLESMVREGFSEEVTIKGDMNRERKVGRKGLWAGEQSMPRPCGSTVLEASHFHACFFAKVFIACARV